MDKDIFVRPPSSAGNAYGNNLSVTNKKFVQQEITDKLWDKGFTENTTVGQTKEKLLPVMSGHQ